MKFTIRLVTSTWCGAIELPDKHFIDISAAYYDLVKTINAEYNPESKIKCLFICLKNKSKMMVYPSGKINIVGVKDIEPIKEGVQIIIDDFLSNYIRKKPF